MACADSSSCADSVHALTQRTSTQHVLTHLHALSHDVLTHQEWATKLQNQPANASSAPATTHQRMAKPFGADLEFHHARIAPAADAAQLNGQPHAAAAAATASMASSDAGLSQTRCAVVYRLRLHALRDLRLSDSPLL